MSICEFCRHDVDVHRVVCGVKDCGCNCFLKGLADGLHEPMGDSGTWPANDLTEDPTPPVWEWAEPALFAVLDLLLEEKEGTVCISTPGGKEARIKIVLTPDLGMVMVRGGRA